MAFDCVSGSARARNRSNCVHIFGLLQRGECGRGGAGAREKYSADDIYFDFLHCAALFGDADQYFGRGAVERGAGVAVYREYGCANDLRGELGVVGDGTDFIYRVLLAIFGDAGLFANSVRGGAGWKFLFGVWQGAPEEAISACIAAGAGAGGTNF